MVGRLWGGFVKAGNSGVFCLVAGRGHGRRESVRLLFFSLDPLLPSVFFSFLGVELGNAARDVVPVARGDDVNGSAEVKGTRRKGETWHFGEPICY
jgi:hypothetical protein